VVTDPSAFVTALGFAVSVVVSLSLFVVPVEPVVPPVDALPVPAVDPLEEELPAVDPPDEALPPVLELVEPPEALPPVLELPDPPDALLPEFELPEPPDALPPVELLLSPEVLLSESPFPVD
jgi:hypothetical protein